MNPDASWWIGGAIAGGGLLVMLAAVLAYRHERRKRELEHAERMKALEAGLPLPDAEVARARAVGLATTLIVVTAMASAALGTWLVLPRLEQPPHLLAALGIIWGCAAGVGVLTAVTGMAAVRRSAGSPEAKKTVRYE
jgi:heme A synthase